MSPIRLFTAIDGRIGLGPFWLGSAAVALTLLLIERTALHLWPFKAGMIIAFAHAFALFPWAALAAKRAVDRGSAPLFGILLVCAIVLPAELKPAMSVAWGPSLDTISLIAWVVALVDLGLMPGQPHDEDAVAAAPVDARACSEKVETTFSIRNMLNILVWREFFSSGRFRPDGKRARPAA